MPGNVPPRFEMPKTEDSEESQTDQLPNDNTIYALVIGINVYQCSSEPGWPTLKAARADADAFQNFLVNGLKASRTNIINLRDAEATRQGILNAFKRLERISAATVDPCIIIYYAGHGASSPRPKGWEDWATDREWIEQLCPSDIGAVVDGRVVEGIPDRVICGLINSLAKKRGNNITLILDCCHSAGINRHEGPEGISRCIPNPPALTAEANPLHDRVMPGRLADQASGLRGTRALQIPSRFGRTNDHSHVLLAACGKGQSAYELKDGSHGIFTSALLKVFERETLEEETYESLVERLDMPRWQAAHCMGANSDRPPFNRRGSRSDPSYIPCKSGGQNTFTLYAGEAQGIENGQQFTIHRKIPSESGTPSQPSIGTMQVVKLESTSSQLAFLAGVPKPEKLPKVFYAHPSSSVKQDPSAIYCQDRQLLDAIFPPNVCGQEVKHARYPTQAALILTADGDKVHIDWNDPALSDYIPTRFACDIKRSDTKRLQNTIRAWSHFNYFLHRQPRNSIDDVFPQVRMELHYLEFSKEYSSNMEHQPVGKNLLQEEPARITVSDADQSSLLGMTLYNDGHENVYPYLFYFDPNDLTITPWVMPAKGVAGGGHVDAPLLPGSKLTLGYGNGGATPWEFAFSDARTKDIGFFKLFLSSSPADFRSLARKKTPFEQEEGQRHGEELDREAKEAERLKHELDDRSQIWGVKMATVIQIRG